MERIKKIKEISKSQYDSLINKIENKNIRKILTEIYANLDFIYDKAIENSEDREMYRCDKYVCKELDDVPVKSHFEDVSEDADF